MSAAMYVPRFFVKQKITMMVNRYQIIEAAPDGSEGRLVAMAQQKRMAFKEQVTFFADEARTEPVFGFRARQAMDLAAGYDITDAAGQPLGYFKKQFGASLLRTTFDLEGPGYAGVGQERNMAVAVLRRFTDISFLPIHFDFTAADGTPLVSIERQMALRDKYTVTVPDQRVDFRVAAAVAVAMDALMAR